MSDLSARCGRIEEIEERAEEALDTLGPRPRVPHRRGRRPALAAADRHPAGAGYHRRTPPAVGPRPEYGRPQGPSGGAVQGGQRGAPTARGHPCPVRDHR